MKDWIMYHPDAGVEAPAPEPVQDQAEPQPVQETAPEPQYEKPKYFSQVAPSKADSEDYKGLWKYQKIDELADAAIAMQKENEELRKTNARSIVVPDGSDPEAVREFARKLGVPDAPEGYQLKCLQKLNADADLLSTVRKACHDGMLTDKQAQIFDQMVLRISEAGLKKAIAEADGRKNNFEANLRASYSDISSEADRTAAAERDKASFRAFLGETGLARLWNDDGTAYDPRVVRAVADYARKHSGQVQVQTVPGGKTTEPGKTSTYGDDFMKRYGR